MTHMHLAHVPWLVGGRPGDLEALLDAVAMDGVDVIDPDRHPHSLIAAAAALAVLAQEDLGLARADPSERWRLAPIPSLLESELFEPGEALRDIRDVQDRRDALGVHEAEWYARGSAWGNGHTAPLFPVTDVLHA